MNSAETAIYALNLRYLLDYPGEAAQRMEAMPAAEVGGMLSVQPVHAILPAWQHLTVDVQRRVAAHLPSHLLGQLLSELEPADSALMLNGLESERQQGYLALLTPQVSHEIHALMQYPADSAGEIMDPRFAAFRSESTVEQALERLRQHKRRGLRDIFLIDQHERLHGRIEVQDIALAEPDQLLGTLAQPVFAAVLDTAPREEVVEKLQQDAVSDLPVVNLDGKMVGVIQQSALVTAMQEETSLDIQTMVGVSKDERALSKVSFAVVKRLPWLQINLLTAFLAAAVVGVFENTIAQFTALAVLLPVVAGQSGNAGAQALAVTMRGLVLREISLRHWPRVVSKEMVVGLLNGVAIAATTALGVYIWSRSVGLCLVIAISMIISMVAAGFSGAIVPIALRRIGQDPAQSSSIILTTVTDVVGFFSFLGVATLMAQWL